LVQRYIAVSRDLAGWLVEQVGVGPERITQIYNGVDSRVFRPGPGSRSSRLPEGFAPRDAFVVGTIGRLAAVKDQETLIRAFARVRSYFPEANRPLRLVIVGDGEMRGRLRDCIREEGLADFVWLAGERRDVPELLKLLDLFVLPSLAEGISNTILEAMACALPVVATRTGGNPELVDDGVTGALVAVSDPVGLAEAIAIYVRSAELCRRHGRAGMDRVGRQFDWDRCVAAYLEVYDDVLGSVGARHGLGRKVGESGL
jgi:sugar transferase (PEP-CTERM/EpsH1 system associated)